MRYGDLLKRSRTGTASFFIESIFALDPTSKKPFWHRGDRLSALAAGGFHTKPSETSHYPATKMGVSNPSKTAPKGRNLTWVY